MPKLKLGSQLVVAERHGPGRYTWTMPSLLGDMLHMAQRMFGERDRSYTLLGVEFCGDLPRVWCPGNRRDLIVQVAVRCMNEPERACYQMAHECIHLLGPSGCSSATVLEEGLATWFAQHYMAERLGNPNWRSTLYSYRDAQRQYEVLHTLDPDAIRMLRQEQPTFNLFTRELLLKHYPALGEAAADALLQPFKRELEAPDEPIEKD